MSDPRNPEQFATSVPTTAADEAKAGGVLNADYDPFAPEPRKPAASPATSPAGDDGVLNDGFDPFRSVADPNAPENARLKAVLDAATISAWSGDPSGRARRIGALSQITRIPVDVLAGVGEGGIDEIEKRAKLVANDPVRFRRQYPALADALLNSPEARNFVVEQAPPVTRFVKKLGILFGSELFKPVVPGLSSEDMMAVAAGTMTSAKFQALQEARQNEEDNKLWDALSEVDAQQTYRKAGPNAPDSTVEAAKNSFKDLKRLAILGKIYVGNGTPEDELTLARINESMVPTDPSGQGPVRQVVNVGAQMLGMQAANLGARGGGAAAAYGAASLATLALTRNPKAANAAGRAAAAFGGKAAEMAAIYAQTTLSAYGAYRDTLDENGRPIDDATAKIVAAAYATIATAALAKGQQAIYATYGKALGNAAAGGEEAFGRKILGNAELRSALLKEYGKRIATAGRTEAGAMAVQTLGQDAGQWLARNASAYGGDFGRYKAPTTEEVGRAFGNAAEQAFGGGIMGVEHGTFGAATGYYRTMSNYRQDAARAKAMPEVAKALAENKDLAVAMPETIAKMVAKETAESGAPVTHVYVDAKAAVNAARRADGTVDSDLLDAIGERLTGKTGKEAGDAVLDAANRGDRIEVPLAKFISDVATTNLAQRLALDTAVDPRGLTAREHAEYQPQIVARAKELVDQWERDGQVPDDPAADADAAARRKELEAANEKLPESRRRSPEDMDNEIAVHRAMRLATLAAWNDDRATRGEKPLAYEDLFGDLPVEIGAGDERAATTHERGGFVPGDGDGESRGWGVHFDGDDEAARTRTAGGRKYVATLPGDDELLDHGAPLDRQPAKARRALVDLLGLQPADVEVKANPDGGFDVVVRNGEGQVIRETWAEGEAEANRLAEEHRAGGAVDPGMTGGEMYDELALRRGGRREASEALREAGVPGLRYDRPDGKGRGYVVWDAGRMPISETLNQAAAAPAADATTAMRRGWTTILADGAKRLYKIALAPTSDFTTFVHESAHVYIDVMSALAQRDDAPEQFRRDYETALKFMHYGSHAEREASRVERAALGDRAAKTDRLEELEEKIRNGTATDDEKYERAALSMSVARLTSAERARHEELAAKEDRFAKGFEKYLMEGNAPTANLAGLFQRFKLWLLDVYGAGGPGVDLNDDIRGVFDRMLASEKEIEATRDALALRPLYRSPEEAGMTPEEWRAYIAEQHDSLTLAARRLAVKMFADRARENGRWWRAKRSKAVDEAGKEYDDRMIVKVARFLRTGEPWDGMPEALQKLLTRPDGSKVRIRLDDMKAILHSDDRKKAEADLAAEEARVKAAGERMSAETRERQRQLRRDRDAKLGEARKAARDEIKSLREVRSKTKDKAARDTISQRIGEIRPELERDLETLRADYDKAIAEEREKLYKWHEDRAAELTAARRKIKADDTSGSDRLIGLCSKDGIEAETLAEWFGFPSARAMLEGLAGLESRDDYTRQRADELMAERHPEVANEWQTLSEEAEKALHNDHTGRWLVHEMSALAARKSPSGKPTPIESIRLAAREIVAKRVASETTTGSDLQAEQRASRAALAAAARGEYERAFAAKQQQLLNYWIYREAMRAREERDAFADALRSAAKPETRKTIGLAGQSLIDVTDSLLETLGFREYDADETRPPRMYADDLADRLYDLGIDPAFDPRMLDETLVSGKWDEMTVAEMRNAAAALKQIRRAATAVDRVDKLGRRVAVGDLVEQIGAESEGLHDRGEALPPNTPVPFGYEATETAAGWNAALTEPRLLFKYLGKAAYDFFYGNYRRCRDNEDADIRRIMPFFLRQWQAFCKGDGGKRFEEVDASELPFKPELGYADRRTRLWAIMLAVAMGTQSNRDRTCGVKVLDKHGDPVLDADGNPIIKGGFGWDQDKVVAWLDKTLTHEEWDFVESVWKLMDGELWPRLAKMERDVHGTAPDKVEALPIELSDGRVVSGGYFPLHADPNVRGAARDKEADAAALSMFGAFGGKTAMPHSFTHARAGRADYVVNLDWNVVPQHVIDVLHYVHFYGFVRDAQTVMKNADFSNLVKRRLGKQSEGAMEDWLKSVANARSAALSKTEGYILRGFNAVRSRFIMRVLGWSVTVPAGDLSNAFVAWHGGVIKGRYLASTLLKAVSTKPWLAMRRECLEKSNTLRRRSDDTRQRYQMDMADVGKAGDRSAAGRKASAFRNASWFMFDVTDKLMSTIIWHSAYLEGKAKNLGEAGARTFADDAVDRTLPSREAPEQSGFVRSRAVGAQQAVFYGYFNKLYNLEREIWHDAAQAHLNGDSLFNKAGKDLHAAARTFGVLVASNLLGEYLTGRGPEKDEKWAEWAARKTAAAPFLLFPVVGALGEWGVNAAFHKMFHDKQGQLAKFSVRSSPFGAGVQTLVSDIQDVLAPDAREADVDQRIWAALDAAGTAANLPTHNPRRTLEYAERALAGKTTPKGPIDAAGHLIYGERRKQAANPASTLSDAVGEGDEGEKP